MTVICAGPMLLGVVLLLGLMAVCFVSNTDTHTREVLICMITYTLLASIMASSFFTMVVTRYVADMLYQDEFKAILPSFWGSNVIMMTFGSIVWGIFLVFSGATALQQFLCFIFFNELIVVWNATNYLTAVKDYKGVFLSFVTSIVTALVFGVVLVLALKLPVVESLLFSVTVGYGLMVVWHIVLLHRYFPKSDERAFLFLKYVDEFLPLAFSGFFINAGMFAHLVIMWFSDIGVRVHGLFFGAPSHDVPALIAFMTTIITTVNFVVSVEVNFYPKYRNQYSLYNDKGTIGDILQAEKEMLSTLKTEIFYTALKQLLFTIVCIAFGGFLFDVLPLGFNEMMRGYFRTLCVGYGLYAIGNMVMLILMYFTDYKGALLCTLAFAVSSVVLTIFLFVFSPVYYGFGFLLSALIFLVVGIIRLDYYTKRLAYYILAASPLVSQDKSGFFTKTGEILDEKIGNNVKNFK